ncbi:NINE protein [Sinomonas susongensis]|uniref:NINE protein n=1 Tax=Sinomonas susongensis TaxID=1324851 RepID=UPI001108FFA0|nr:NINE protein [Sinomonas susongensis]
MGYTEHRILHTNKKQLKVQKQIAANTAAQVQIQRQQQRQQLEIQKQQLEIQRQQMLISERHRLDSLAATHVAEGTMTRPQADEFVELEMVNFAVPPAQPRLRVRPAGILSAGGNDRESLKMNLAGWYKDDAIARYWDGARWTLQTMPLEQAKALVRREWEAAGDAAAASGAPLKSRKVAGLLAIFLGCFGIHRMYLGSGALGFLLLLFCLLTSFFLFGVPSLIIGIVDGVKILRGVNPEFQRDSRGLPLRA